MRGVLITAVALVVLCAPAVMAAPVYNSALVVSHVWDLTISNDGNKWNWLVTLNDGAVGYYGGIVQSAEKFIIYDNDAGRYAGSDLKWNMELRTNGASVVWRWVPAGGDVRLFAGESTNFWATIDNLGRATKAVFRINEVNPETGAVTRYYARQLVPGETPELSTWMLLGLSGLAGAFITRRRRP